MKGKWVEVMAVLVLVAAVIVYAQITYSERAAIRQQIEGLWTSMTQVNSLLQIVGDRSDRHADKVRELERRVSAEEGQSQQLIAKITALEATVNTLQSQITVQAKPIVLPVISVNKKAKK